MNGDETQFPDLYDEQVQTFLDAQRRRSQGINLEVTVRFAAGRLAEATNPLREKPVSPGHVKRLERELRKAETDLAAWKLSQP